MLCVCAIIFFCCVVDIASRKMKETTTRQNSWSKNFSVFFRASPFTALLHHERHEKETDWMRRAQNWARKAAMKRRKSVSFRWVYKRMRKLFWWRFGVSSCAANNVFHTLSPTASTLERTFARGRIRISFRKQKQSIKMWLLRLSASLYKKNYIAAALGKYLRIIYQTQNDLTSSPSSLSSSSSAFSLLAQI